VTAFLFDLDGVLVKTHELVLAGWRRFAATRGRTVSDDEIIESMFGRRTYDVLVEGFGLSAGEAAELEAAMADRRADVAAGPPLCEVPGATEFVRAALADGIPSALASSASRLNIGLALDAIGLSDAFDVIVDEGTVRLGKPAPDPFLAAARGLGVAPSECVVFEDTAPGITAGLAAGARCVGIATLRRPAFLAGADLVLDDFVGRTPRGVIADLAARPPGDAAASGS
jgi:HAD superfamily hydrolase (TIGR01509 family)